MTDVLYHAMSKTHNVFCLMARKTSDRQEAGFVYLPNDKDLHSKENYLFVHDFIVSHHIDFVINQDGITPKYSEFIIRAASGYAKVITVLHNELTRIYGVETHLPPKVVVYMPQCLLNVANCISHYYFRHKYGRYWRLAVEQSHSICLLDDSMKASTIRFLRCFDYCSKFVAINNPITLCMPPTHIDVVDKKKQLLYVGRLSGEKNLEMLLKIWSMIERKHKEWSLQIVGDGPERKRLTEMANDLQLRNVRFEGQKSPEAYYADASIFCMTSLYEGLPLVLLEAMSYSVVPIAFNSFSSLPSIIDNGINGYIIRPYDLKEYAETLSSLMSDIDMRSRMSFRAFDKVGSFSLNRILTAWDELFTKSRQFLHYELKKTTSLSSASLREQYILQRVAEKMSIYKLAESLGLKSIQTLDKYYR